MSKDRNALGYDFNDYYDAFHNHFTVQGILVFSSEEHQRAEFYNQFYINDYEKTSHFYSDKKIKFIRAVGFVLKVQTIGKREFYLCCGEQRQSRTFKTSKELESFTPQQLVNKVIAIQQGIIAIAAEYKILNSLIRDRQGNLIPTKDSTDVAK